jgi:hypothetical protein
VYWQDKKQENVAIGMVLHASPDMFYHLEEQVSLNFYLMQKVNV